MSARDEVVSWAVMKLDEITECCLSGECGNARLEADAVMYVAVCRLLPEIAEAYDGARRAAASRNGSGVV